MNRSNWPSLHDDVGLHEPLGRNLERFAESRAGRDALGNEDLRRVRACATALAKLGPEAAIADVFDTLRTAVGFAGALQVAGDTWNPPDLRVRSFDMPESFLGQLLAWQGNPDPTPFIAQRVSPGRCWHPFEMAPERAIRELDLVQNLFPRASDMDLFVDVVIAHCPSLHGHTTHTVELFQERGRPLASIRRDCTILEHLCPSIERAFHAASLPCSLGRGDGDRVIQEQARGLVFVNESGRIVEINRRAIELLDSYYPDLSSRGWPIRDVVTRLIVEALNPELKVVVPHVSRAAMLQVYVHRLDPDAARGTLHLLDLSEHLMPLAPSRHAIQSRLREAKLTPRQIDVAERLVSTGASAKEIAAELECSTETVNKHVETIYRKLRVHSRVELIAKIAHPGR